jgi:hypothetical protein
MQSLASYIEQISESISASKSDNSRNQDGFISSKLYMLHAALFLAFFWPNTKRPQAVAPQQLHSLLADIFC